MFIISNATVLPASHVVVVGVEKQKNASSSWGRGGVKPRGVSLLVYCQPIFSMRKLFFLFLIPNPSDLTESGGKKTDTNIQTVSPDTLQTLNHYSGLNTNIFNDDLTEIKAATSPRKLFFGRFIRKLVLLVWLRNLCLEQQGGSSSEENLKKDRISVRNRLRKSLRHSSCRSL